MIFCLSSKGLSNPSILHSSMPSSILLKINSSLVSFIMREFLSSTGLIEWRWSKVWDLMLLVFMSFGIIMKFPKEFLILKPKIKTSLSFWNWLKFTNWTSSSGLALMFVESGILVECLQDYSMSRALSSVRIMRFFLKKPKFTFHNLANLSRGISRTKKTQSVQY